MKKSLLYGTIFTTLLLATALLPNKSLANITTCDNKTLSSSTCETLGFTTACSSCGDKSKLPCPQDSTKCFCPEVAATPSGQGAFASEGLAFDDIMDGKGNTQKLVAAYGKKILPAYAASQFYPYDMAKDDPLFGQGQWYLPSSGEWFYDILGIGLPFCDFYNNNVYSFDFSPVQMTLEQIEGADSLECNEAPKSAKYVMAINDYPAGDGELFPHEFSIDSNDDLYAFRARMNNLINQLDGINYNEQGSNVNPKAYHTSTMITAGKASYQLRGRALYDSGDMFASGFLGNINASTPFFYSALSSSGSNLPSSAACVRVLNYLDNVLTGITKPSRGDVLYHDLTFGPYSANSEKLPIGVIVWVSESGKSVKIINLKNLSFSSQDGSGNFDPTLPYQNITAMTYFSTESELADIADNGISSYLPNMRDVTSEGSFSRALLDVSYLKTYGTDWADKWEDGSLSSEECQ